MVSHRTVGLVLALAGTLFPAMIRPQAAGSGSSSALVVTVYGPANRPVAGAKVEIDGQGRSIKLEAVTRKDGTYSGPALATGHYRMVVSAQCYKEFENSFEVPGAPANYTVSLSPAGGTGCESNEFEFADSGGLKAGEIAGAVDAAGYSSQAEARSTELLRVLAEIVAGPGGDTTGDQEGSILFRRGLGLLRQGYYQEAASVFRNVVDRDLRSRNALLALGVTYYAGGHHDEAAESLCKAVDLDPADPRPYFFLARANWTSAAESAPVLGRLEANAQSHPSNAAAQYDYAMALLRAQVLGQAGIDSVEVKRLLRSAVALDPSFAEAHFELGVVLSTNEPGDAIGEFQRVVALQPDWADAHYRLGQLYQRNGAGDKARRELAEYDRLHQRGPIEQEQRLRDELRSLRDQRGD